MAVKIQLYGQLKQIAGTSELLLDASDTDELMKLMIARYPSLEKLNCLVAVDRNIIQGNTAITDAQELALLPPYSGG